MRRAAVAAFPAAACAVAVGAGDARPNFLLLLADDLGYADVGFHNSTPLTPNIDALAAGGVILEQFYVNPICSPTRSSLMTGRFTYRLGTQATVIRADVPFGVPLGETFLPQNLKAAGYRTALFGKWHLGFYQWGYTPLARGFDEHMGYFQGQIHYYTHEGFGYGGTPSGMDWHRGNQTDSFADAGNYTMPLIEAAAVDFLHRMADGGEPFFLYLPWHLVHNPEEVDDSYKARYPDLNGNRQTKMAMVAALDDGIGGVVSALRSHPAMYNRTVVFFSADNGAPNSGGTNYPLRGWKTQLYEGGIRAAAFVHSPLIPAAVRGTACAKLFHVVDVLPTFVALAGGSAAGNRPLDGADIWRAVTTPAEADGGAPSPHSELLVNLNPSCHKGYVKPNAGMRIGDWKLLVDCFNYTTMNATGKVELYNVGAGEDPNEQTDLAGSEPAKVAELLARLAGYARSADQAPPTLFPGLAGWNYQCPQCAQGGARPSPAPPAAPALAPGACRVEDDTGYAGNDIRSVDGVASAGDCCAACSAEAACRAWTLVGTRCWLKSSDAGRKAAAGHVSGAPWAAACATEEDTDFAGNDVRAVGNVTAAPDCCAACSADAACAAWSWHRGSAKCFLKSSDAGRHAVTGSVSGARAGGAPPAPPLTFNPWCDDVVCVPGDPPPHVFDAGDEQLLSSEDQYTVDPSAGGVSDW